MCDQQVASVASFFPLPDDLKLPRPGKGGYRCSMQERMRLSNIEPNRRYYR